MKFLRPKSAFLSFFLALPLSLQVFAQTAQPTGPSPEMQKANALYQAQKWDEAVTAYATVTKTEPKNGMAWFRLGYAHHSLGHFDKAVEAYLQSVAIGNNPVVMYNLACAYSRLKNNDKAFEWLNKAVAGGYTQTQQIQTDPDLEGVRADSRYPELQKNIDKTSNPCKYDAKSREFDFWIGEWDVSSQGQKTATSSIQNILGSCVIFENYQTKGGYTGKSFNYYDATVGKWHQTWVDAVGGSIEFTGEFKGGSMVLEGESHQLNGTKSLQRMTFTQLDKDKVRQFGETSADGGKTWSVSYDLLYERKKN